MGREFIDILNREMVPAEGCTEPIAVAYAVSLAVDTLGETPKNIDILLSANVIKNALGVGIPGTGKVGIDIAAALGAIIKKPEKKLEILKGFSEEELKKANELISSKKIKVSQKDTKEKLYIEVIAKGENNNSKVIILKDHTNVVLIEKNGEMILDKEINDVSNENVSKSSDLTIKSIYEFAVNTPFEEIEFILKAADINSKVSEEGLKGGYGLEVGNKIIENKDFNLFTNNMANKIIAATAAASDARMDGCTMTIMTTAGSGNQGIACSMPIVETAKALGKSKEDLARALVISNLITIHLKEYMGRLSPLCGAGIAGATGACCGITYLLGGNLTNIKHAVNNMISDIAGMICDGAKSTCALKIATATNAALQCATLAMNNISPSSKDGIVFGDAEDTIRNIEVLVKEGLSNTDNTILNIMLTK
ncbi:serine dehydratase subunit alpha family protein [Clostridium baratii]|uniref:L-cysteine desulfidase family protein n=1 Tax=Clostridium baratii TaxID=1561 RepID=UPI001C01EDA6|nr:L-serine ammonia-lyase, iron-sulfur-dependent, subunit alpha [Clostridium baratii]MBT9830532.1 serine dehydratase subunit alpha family protein [Clostridium baratii]MDY3206363.1 L-serine ammonia-lyase, iron-sulfur-dependent, subunit alpha [Clostridium baratii]